jgi:hypothetical protein
MLGYSSTQPLFLHKFIYLTLDLGKIQIKTREFQTNKVKLFFFDQIKSGQTRQPKFLFFFKAISSDKGATVFVAVI